MAFENPVAMPGAVSIALDPNGEPESFYADGIEYYIIANNMGYDGDLELLSIGLINDMYCESRNDSYSYAVLGTQQDMDLF